MKQIRLFPALIGILTITGPASARITETAPDSAPEVTWQLHETAEVDGNGVFLSQVVSMTTAAALPDVCLAAAPPVRDPITWSRQEIEALASSHGISTESLRWKGADQIKVRRRSRNFDQTELHQLLTDAVQAAVGEERGEVEIQFARPWEPIVVPDELLEVELLAVPTGGISPNFMLRFELRSGTERLGAWSVMLQGTLWADVIVAGGNLRRGELLANADLVVERRDILGLRQPLVPSAVLSEPTLEMRENVRSGTVLEERSVQLRPLINRRELVNAVLMDGRVNISLKVEALEDGVRGQRIRVRNPKSRQEFYGEVYDSKTILVSL